MKYYKTVENDEIVSFEARSSISTDERMTEITQEEYEELLQEYMARCAAEQEQIEIEERSKDERISELESENAALLYQVLTGEELTDV